MKNQAPTEKFTGKHMLAIFVIGFGIVAAVNFFMASLAVGGFHGIVVENSYVASQKFNTWLEEAEKSRELGWEASMSRSADGTVALKTNGVPDGATIGAELRRPLGTRDYASLTFEQAGQGVWVSQQPVANGRWTARLRIEASGAIWTQESELQ